MKIERRAVECRRRGQNVRLSGRGRLHPALPLLLPCLLLFSAGCSSSEHPAADPWSNPLYRDPAVYDFSGNPALLDRILAGPHGYFRFINIPFGAYVCQRFDSALRSPALNLHGDAHLEQYAVTDVGRGLTDFDDSSSGPGYIDLIRFGVSVRIACRENHWERQSEELLDTFLDAYREALLDTTARAPEPEVVRRIRGGFHTDRAEYFRYVESVMDPVPDGEREALVQAMDPYISSMMEANPGLSKSFFSIREVGYLRLGIGSALDRKYLVRMDGPSPAALDDLVLEVKEVRNLEGIPCVNAEAGDPFRILLGHSRIAYQPYGFLGYLRFDGSVFWIHSWVQNYQELDVRKSLRNPRELREVVRDVGIQLGLGHPKLIASPFDDDLRRDVIRLVDRDRDVIKAACRDLEEKLVAAWSSFRKATAGQIPPVPSR